MAMRQRFPTPIIQLPWVPAELEPFKHQIEVYFNQVLNQGVLRANEFDFTGDLIRGGTNRGQYLPVGAMYVDEDFIVRVVAPDQQWVMPTQVTVNYGTVSAI
jgi:hypothetical protein